MFVENSSAYKSDKRNKLDAKKECILPFSGQTINLCDYPKNEFVFAIQEISIFILSRFI